MPPGERSDGTIDTRFGADVVGVNGMSLAHVLGNIERQFLLTPEGLCDIVEHFNQLMHYGLNNKNAAMPMIPTFVTGLPDGTEQGTFLAMDLGGTNLRVCAITLKGGGDVSIKQEKYKVQDSLKLGPVADLFSYMAESVDVFLNENEVDTQDDETLSMGFTFSFPIQQRSIDSGTLLSWSKGFNCPDAVGQDMVKLLQTALDRRHLKVKVEALINDTTGTLLASSYRLGGSFLGAIFGTGTNGAYLESVEAIGTVEVPDGAEDSSIPTHMIINTEWGSFDNARQALPVTQYDNKVDRTAIRQRHHIFEKMVSGMYLGEVFRSVLVNMIDQLLLFNGFAAESLNNKYALETYIMSMIEEDIDQGLDSDDPNNQTWDIVINKLGVPKECVNAQDIEVVRRVCRWVGTRAARLSAAAIAATVIQTGHAPRTKGSKDTNTTNGHALYSEGKLNVGADGSLVELYPHFRERIHEALVEILGQETADRVQIGVTKDGSGVGAALSALLAKKQRSLGHNVVAK